VSLSVTAGQGVDMLGSRTLLRPGGLHREVPGPDRLPKPTRRMNPGWHPSPASDHSGVSRH